MDLRVAPSGFFSHLYYESCNILIDAWTAFLTRLIRWTILWPVLHCSHPSSKRRIAGYGNQIFDASPQFQPVLDQPPPLLIVQLDAIR